MKTITIVVLLLLITFVLVLADKPKTEALAKLNAKKDLEKTNSEWVKNCKKCKARKRTGFLRRRNRRKSRRVPTNLKQPQTTENPQNDFDVVKIAPQHDENRRMVVQ